MNGGVWCESIPIHDAIHTEQESINRSILASPNNGKKQLMTQHQETAQYEQNGQTHVATDATAFAHRDKQGMVLITHFAPLSIDAASLDARTQQVFQPLLPYANGAYVGFIADEGAQRVHEVYPPATYERLVVLKNQYDPTNLFHRNQNIKPTATPATLAAPMSS